MPPEAANLSNHRRSRWAGRNQQSRLSAVSPPLRPCAGSPALLLDDTIGMWGSWFR